MNILYVTHDGITDHIGQSQIAPYLLGSSGSENSVFILSVEKKTNSELILSFKNIFKKKGIHWVFLNYSKKFSFLSFFIELILLSIYSFKIIKNNKIDIIHCRCYPAAFVGLILKKVYSKEIKLIFDVRDFWLDTRIETRIIKFPYRFLKLFERKLYASSDVFVTLTEKARDIIKLKFKNDVASKRFYVIPCCADFSLFDTKKIKNERKDFIRETLSIKENNFLFGYLGSLGPDYLLEDMIKVFSTLLDLKKDSIFLFISNNGQDKVIKAFEQSNLSLDQLRYVSLDRKEVPDYLSILDMSIIFIRPSESKAGCSPTKLGELFAMNVPVIANSKVGDLDSLIDLNKNCSSVVSLPLSSKEVKTSLKKIISKKEEYKKIRKNSLNLSLETGIGRYMNMYNNLNYD